MDRGTEVLPDVGQFPPVSRMKEGGRTMDAQAPIIPKYQQRKHAPRRDETTRAHARGVHVKRTMHPRQCNTSDAQHNIQAGDRQHPTSTFRSIQNHICGDPYLRLRPQEPSSIISQFSTSVAVCRVCGFAYLGEGSRRDPLPIQSRFCPRLICITRLRRFHACSTALPT